MLAGVMKARIDRARLAAQELGRFLEAHLVHQPQLDHGAMLGAQLAHGGENDVAQLGVFQAGLLAAATWPSGMAG